jgi:hypothetical protein
MTVQALLEAEVSTKVAPVTEPEIETFYQANKARLKGDEATVREQIRAHLQKQELAARREGFVQSLRSQATVVVHLKAPAVFRAAVSVDGAPFKGSATAPGLSDRQPPPLGAEGARGEGPGEVLGLSRCALR